MMIKSKKPAGKSVPWPTKFTLLGIFSFIWVAVTYRAWPFGGASVLAGDAFLYKHLIDNILSGDVPYFSLAFGHFPLMLAPMFAAYLLSFLSGIHFTLSFAILMLLVLLITGGMVSKLGRYLDVSNAADRWLYLAGPLFPLVLFRLDPFPTLMAVLAIFLAFRERGRLSIITTIAGIFSKGWPVVLAVTEWLRGRRARAIGYVVFTLILVSALLFTPGFREGRKFVGVHMETLSGSFLVAYRMIVGAPLGLEIAAGAVYVDTNAWALVINMIVGLGVGITAIRKLQPTNNEQLIVLTGVLIYAVMFASPLLSAQFMLWPTPFIAFAGSRTFRFAVATSSILTTLLVSIWAPIALWWHVVILLRNVVLLTSIVVYTVGFAGDFQEN